MLTHAMEQPKSWVPCNIQAQCVQSTKLNDIQEFCGGVTNPETGKRITSYKTLLKIPELKDI